ncbi:uncharacterized protein LOC131990823 isoform X2 [Centropristis striata]|uniref:uncharacterized protein LOC131990823 isoform X2 n=1 Tax=Centropristis striata TaxID=184440 RepID=UPI0027DF5B4D|nr:uncharacterized protein LOC131990823 isoform X2 [Centropristis striata]
MWHPSRHLAAPPGQLSPNFVVRVGDVVMLPCENVMHDQDGCSRTQWIFSCSRSNFSFTLGNLGQIDETSKAKSDRLSVAENCSLVIKTVTVEDVGRYTCRRSGSQDAHVYLSVINMTEQKDGGLVIMNCSVLTDEWCRNTVEWLYEPHMTIVTTSRSECSAAVSFPAREKKRQEAEYEFFKCNVTDENTGAVQLFDFNPPVESSTTAPPITDQGLWRTIIVSVGLAALIVTVVSVNIWMRTKGNRTQTAVHNDADEGSVVYENVGEPSVSIRLP